MLTRRTRLAFVPVLVLSCQEPVDISSELNEYETLVNDTNGSRCTCYMDLGYSSIVECDDDWDTITSAQRECMDGALAGHEDAAKDYLDCVNTGLQFYSQCLDANVDCEEGSVDSCTDDYMATVAACPALPTDAQTAFDTCLE